MISDQTWRINRHIFNAHERTVKSGGITIVLEPKASDLLRYFCLNPARNISRDELLEKVWHGQVVSDNAINRVVVVLRKALMDNDKIKTVISTVPKIGYQMIANVSDVSDVSYHLITTVDYFKYGLPIFALLGILIWLFIQYISVPPEAGNKQSPLLRQSGDQLDGTISQQDHLAFTSWNETKLNIEVLLKGHSLSHVITNELISAKFPVWAHEKQFLLFVGKNKQGCQVFKAEVENEKISKPSAIYDCTQNEIISLSLDMNDSWVYLAGRESPFAPNSITAFNLENGATIKLNTPVAKGLGHHHIDAHPYESGKFIMISDEKPGISYLYEVDVNQGSHKLLRKIPFHVASASYTHDGEHFIHPSVHPAYELVISAFEEGVSESVLTDSRRVSFPKRHSNGRDYIYTSYLNNREIKQNDVAYPFNSSVMDYLPTTSNDDSRLAFVSKRSGFSAVWVFDFEKDNLVSLTPPDTGRIFYDLKWSWDDRYILANTDSGLLLFDIQLGQSTKEWKTPDLVYAINWLSENSFSYSVFNNKQWQVWQQAINTDQRFIYPKEIGLIISDVSNAYYFDSELNVDSQMNADLTKSQLKLCRQILSTRKSTWTIKNGQLYCVSNQSGHVIGITQGASLASEVKIEPGEFYQWSDRGLIHSELLSSSSDLMLISRDNK